MHITRKLLATTVATALICGAALARPDVVSANQFLQCHDDSTLPIHTWTHGNPNTGLPGDIFGANGYYYLSIKAGCGQRLGSVVTITGTVHLTKLVSGHIDSNGMCWRLDITPDLDSNNRLAKSTPMGTYVHLSYSHAIVGHNYRFRIANTEPGTVVTDHGTFDG